MAKKIIFFVDIPHGVFEGDYVPTYADTEDILQWWIENTGNPNSLVKHARFIYTTSLTHLSFNLLDYDFEIYVVKDEKVLQLKPGMDNVHNKDIKKTHNILKLFLSGFFDEDFKNGEDWEEFQKTL